MSLPKVQGQGRNEPVGSFHQKVSDLLVGMRAQLIQGETNEISGIAAKLYDKIGKQRERASTEFAKDPFDRD